MKSTLKFSEISIEVSNLGQESSLPDLLGEYNIQNKPKSNLTEYDEIYEGYGKLSSIYPYALQNTYDRKLETKPVPVAVLENDYLTATFLPTYGGRLWSLIDKQSGTNLLYTNDVIRPSNLALRNAWFSGGVEWNIGMIGHHPYTMSQLFTAQLTLEDKITPVLRFYEFERIRKVAYQIDFWLENDCRFLNCRMRIHNQNEEVVPMYWWSNMAVPEYPGGRVVVPAAQAYTCTEGVIEKVSIPKVNGVDITSYGNIETQVDYFFNIPENEPKYIANVNSEGYGLLQVSTKRLKGRKLFCWGKSEGSDRWQQFLTKDAGKYVEIQAGLGKTQYGCIPMAPNTAWEWMEQYGAIQISKASLQEFMTAQAEVTSVVKELAGLKSMEETLLETRTLAKTRGTVMLKGSSYGRFENILRKERDLPPLAPQLDFSSSDTRLKVWEDFLEYGMLACPNPTHVPKDCFLDDYLYQKLSDYTGKKGSNHWYAWLHLGFNDYYHKNFKTARKAFLTSDQICANPWAKFGLAVINWAEGDRQNAITCALKGIHSYSKDLSYAKDIFKLLNYCGAYEEIKELYLSLTDEITQNSRIKLYYIIALTKLTEFKEAYDLLMENGGLVVDDIREGEDTIGPLWQEIYRNLYPEGTEKLPFQFNFRSF